MVVILLNPQLLSITNIKKFRALRVKTVIEFNDAIELFFKKKPNRFKRLGSITKLQKAMGPSSINVSLTYLRGLEVPELIDEDMPMI